MNRFRFQAFVEEFHFLEEVVEQRSCHNCDNIQIKRGTKELMAYVPQYNGATGSLVGIDDGERFDFVLDNGDVIKNAVRDGGYCRHNEAHTDDERWDGETVLEAIDKHKVANNLAYIVKLDYGYNIRDHHSLSDYRITIFKPSHEFTWTDLIAEARQKALAEVQAEANF